MDTNQIVLVVAILCIVIGFVYWEKHHNESFIDSQLMGSLSGGNFASRAGGVRPVVN